MNLLNVLRGIKKIQASLTALKLATEPLSDGSTIEYDGESILEGSQVFLKSASGDYSVLPDGEYLTKSNVKFTVKDGLVSAVDTANETAKTDNADEPVKQAQAAAPEDAPAESDAATEDSASDEAADQKQIDDAIQAALAPVWDAIKQLTDTLTMSASKTKEVETTLSKVSDTVEKISKTPAAEPAQGSVTPFKEVPKDIKESRAYKILHGSN